MPRRLARTVRQGTFEVRIDTDFEGVIAGCAASRPGRRTTWINAKIRSLYRELFDTGHCHTVETWPDGRLVGGLYGVALNGAFFGESMFSYRARRQQGGAGLPLRAADRTAASRCSTRSSSPTPEQFGTVEIDRAEFHALLEQALAHQADFLALPTDASPERDPRTSVAQRA